MHIIAKLKKYFRLSFVHKDIPKAELLSSNEALKDFGKLWGGHGADVMTMIAVIEYEYINSKTFTETEIGAVKNTLARVVKFLQGCSWEWQEFEAKQQRKERN